MDKNEKTKKFEEAQNELNQKIEAIMGPTPLGDKPAEGIPVKHAKVDEPAPVQSAPVLPEQLADKTSEIPPSDTNIDTDESLPEDSALDKAVDDIAASESDKLLAVEDKEKQLAEAPPPKKSFGQKIKAFFHAWWSNPKARNTTLIALALILVGLLVFPTTRYLFLNTAGIRSKASVTVLDSSTQQPLKNVQVGVGGQSGQTDEKGYAKLEKVKLGATHLVIKKRAFATIDKKIVIGWGSNPLEQSKLEPSGVQYTFIVKDFLSDKPVEKAEAVSGESSAFSDKDGKIVLTLDKSEADADEAIIKAKNYRDEKRPLDDTKADQSIKLVPSHKHSFVSKRSGKFDVYKIDVDGSNEQVVLAGSGAERDDITLAPHPTANLVSVVSTRDNQRNKDGFLLSALNLVNLDTNKVLTIAHAERVEVVGWANGRFVYVQIIAGASANSPKRYRLMSYNPENEENKELAAANYFNDIILIANKIYYAPSSAYQTANEANLFKVDPDGGNKQIVFNKEVWNIFRTDYEKLTLAVQQDWYEYDLMAQKQPNKIVPPANPKTRVYIANAENKKSIWIDERDGKGALLLYDQENKKESTLKSQSGLKYPVSWVSEDTLVYRINTEQETADYVLNISGGEPKKIRDVTNTAGVDKWYYY